MYNRVVAFDVGCGDCSILQDEDNGMLIDYGGNPLKVRSVLTDVAATLSHFNEKNLMISHLHKDHYCGITLLSNIITFNNVYLPDYICGYGLNLLASALLTKNNYIIDKVNEILKIPNILLTNNLINTNTRIHFLATGNKFSNSLGTFQALLPSLYNCNLSRKIIEKINNNEAINRFISKYYSLLEKIDGSENTFLINENIQQIEYIIEEIINEENDVFNDYEKSRIIDEFKKYHNEMSIVFQNYECTDRNILFCGDALSKNIYKVSSVLHNNYSFIKIPHHGTDRRYYYDYFPKTDKFLIFNDFGTNCTMITSKYDYKYGYDTKFYCTNRHCYKAIYGCMCYSVINNSAMCGFRSNYEIINI